MYHVTHKDDAAVLDYYLITKGANMHVNTNDGQTLLHLAAKVGHDNNLQYLLMKGLDVDAFDNNNYSAIRYASEADKQTTVRILAEWGASITTQRYIPGTRRVLYT
jgi:ankyrin repeat protein